MNIQRLVVGELKENCYIVTKNGKTLIIDPGDEFAYILEHTKNLDVVEVLVTHHHYDHIGALAEVEKYFHIKEQEKSGYFDYEVIKTPGHTSDSITFYFMSDKVMFTGDFIFLNTIGRTDLVTSSDEDMLQSLKLISNYPDDIKIYPGHGSKTTLGHEKNNFKFYY